MESVAEDKLKLLDQARSFIQNPFFIYSVLPDHIRRPIARLEADRYRISYMLVHGRDESFEAASNMLEEINNQLKKVLGL